MSDGMSRTGLSLRKVAKEAGIDPSFFSKVLAEKRSPPSDERALRKLAKVLEIDPVQLIVVAGVIPAELKSTLEDPVKLAAILRGEFNAAAKQERAAQSGSRMVRRAPELSEDLL